MSHSICIIHVATSRFPIQQLLAWRISTFSPYSSRECQGLPRHTIMWNSLGSTWKSRSDSGEHWKWAPHSWEHWKGVPPFVSRKCFPNNPPTLIHKWALPVLEESTGQTLEYRQLHQHPDFHKIWNHSYANELGRLCQGIGTSPDGTL